MNIKAKTTSLRDSISGILNMKNTFERKTNNIQNTLNEVQNTINALSRRPIPPQTVNIDQRTLLTKIFTGVKIYLDPQDLSVAAHIAVDGIWEKQITKAWLAVLKKDDTVLDIGANFGYFGILAGQFTDKKKSKVVLFEANKNLIPYIDKSISVNWMKENVKVENLAISDQIGQVKLNVVKDFLGSSSLQSVEDLNENMPDDFKFEQLETISVDSVTIDSYCKNNNINEINLIKMDIEGYEEKAYKGMRKIIEKSKDVTLFIEFTKSGYDDPKGFYDTMLKDFGFIYTINDNGDIIKPQDTSYNSVVGGNDDWEMLIFSKNQKLDEERQIVL